VPQKQQQQHVPQKQQQQARSFDDLVKSRQEDLDCIYGLGDKPVPAADGGLAHLMRVTHLGDAVTVATLFGGVGASLDDAMDGVDRAFAADVLDVLRGDMRTAKTAVIAGMFSANAITEAFIFGDAPPKGGAGPTQNIDPKSALRARAVGSL
jgi:hypothetical protein